MTARMERTGLAAVAGLLALGLALEAMAQQGKPKVPPQLPPQAAEQARQKVLEHTAPAVSLTAPAAGALYAAPASVLLEATASASSGGKSIAQVEFFTGATLIGTASTAPYSFSWTLVAAGAYSLTARATDNLGVAGTSSPVAITVNAPPTVSLTSPPNGATFTAPADITITADAQDSDGTIASVAFFEGANLIATRTTPPYSILWTGVVAGSYSLTGRATDSQGASTTSAGVNVTVNTGVAQMYFIHTDHLNTPRVITNQASQVVWRWDQTDPFGDNPPDENPSGLGSFTCNLRLPGQYFDKETNLHYNYFRDYDPGIGRYIQSDPIGLAGGINTYLYAYDPLTRIDPLGLMGFGGGGAAGSQSKGVPKRSSACGTGGILRGPEFQFREACIEHDECFDACGRSKSDCDDAFCRKAKDSCPPGDVSCKAQAAFYCSILQSTPALIAYDPAQRAACSKSCKPN